MVNNDSRKDKGKYFLTETMSYSLCEAVQSIVLEENKEAKILVAQIKGSFVFSTVS
jgi:hypothetical protein